MLSAILSIILTLGVLYLARSFLTRKKTPAPLPPGPPPKPIIGNLRDLPAVGAPDWEHWLRHKELYGPISSVSVFGSTIIILNEARLAFELMEKRSAIHSSRPSVQFADMSGWDRIMGLMVYSETFRASRKHLHRQIGSNVSVARFDEVQNVEVGRFLFRLLEQPDDLVHHIRKEAGAIILKVGYGYTIEPHERDPLVDLADKAMEEFSIAILPSSFVVNFVPILKYLPAWFPGAGFQQVAKDFRNNVTAFADNPYQFVKRSIAKKQFEPSFLSRLLEEEQFEPGSEEEQVIKWTAAALYAGGSDTTVSTIACFFLAMTLYPEVQEKAQTEIHKVVGSDRLPGFQDRDKLPYINALCKELLRWHPVAPSGLVHVSTEDDMCEGYFIPKGSQVIANIWAFLHDPETYPDPMAFKPERFLEYEGHAMERDPHFLAFGFGRRVCPGRNLAESNVYLTVVQTLACFTISKAIRDGQEVDVQARFLPGIISHPAPFECSIKPRSARHEKLIRAVEDKYPWEQSHAHELKEG